MKRITKYYAKLAQAERYQNRLYNLWERVTLVTFPRFSESGYYTWEVSQS